VLQPVAREVSASEKQLEPRAIHFHLYLPVFAVPALGSDQRDTLLSLAQDWSFV
jgi:hypothetical protein